MICKNCGEPVERGGTWTGQDWPGWVHCAHRTEHCIVDGHLSVDSKAEPAERPDTCWNCGMPHNSREDGCDACDA